MKNITTIAYLFKYGNRFLAIIHETSATINFVAEYMEKIAKAARETPLDAAQHSRPLERFACMRKARLSSFFC
jgi:hypothetical protein